MLFAYNSGRNELQEVNIKTSNSITLVPDDTKQILVPKDTGVEEAVINSSDIHFEALNHKTAARRLAKFKSGKIKELCNLGEVNPHGIKFY